MGKADILDSEEFDKDPEEESDEVIVESRTAEDRAVRLRAKKVEEAVAQLKDAVNNPEEVQDTETDSPRLKLYSSEDDPEESDAPKPDLTLVKSEPPEIDWQQFARVESSAMPGQVVEPSLPVEPAVIAMPPAPLNIPQLPLSPPPQADSIRQLRRLPESVPIPAPIAEPEPEPEPIGPSHAEMLEMEDAEKKEMARMAQAQLAVLHATEIEIPNFDIEEPKRPEAA